MDKKEELKKYKLLLEEGIIDQAEYNKVVEDLIVADTDKVEETVEAVEMPAETNNETPNAKKKGKNTKTIAIVGIVICIMAAIGIVVFSNPTTTWTLSQVFQINGTELNSEDYTATLVTKEKEATVTINGETRTLAWASTISDSSILGIYGEFATGITDTNEAMIVKFFEQDGYQFCVVSGFDDRMYLFVHL